MLKTKKGFTYKLSGGQYFSMGRDSRVKHKAIFPFQVQIVGFVKDHHCFFITHYFVHFE